MKISNTRIVQSIGPMAGQGVLGPYLRVTGLRYLPTDTKYDLIDISRIIKPAEAKYQELRIDLLKECSKLNEQGEVIPDAQGNGQMKSKEDRMRYMKEHKELLERTVEIPNDLVPMPLSKFKSRALEDKDKEPLEGVCDSNDLELLEWLIYNDYKDGQPNQRPKPEPRDYVEPVDETTKPDKAELPALGESADAAAG